MTDLQPLHFQMWIKVESRVETDLLHNSRGQHQDCVLDLFHWMEQIHMEYSVNGAIQSCAAHQNCEGKRKPQQASISEPSRQNTFLLKTKRRWSILNK